MESGRGVIDGKASAFTATNLVAETRKILPRAEFIGDKGERLIQQRRRAKCRLMIPNYPPLFFLFFIFGPLPKSFSKNLHPTCCVCGQPADLIIAFARRESQFRHQRTCRRAQRLLAARNFFFFNVFIFFFTYPVLVGYKQTAAALFTRPSRSARALAAPQAHSVRRDAAAGTCCEGEVGEEFR